MQRERDMDEEEKEEDNSICRELENVRMHRDQNIYWRFK